MTPPCMFVWTSEGRYALVKGRVRDFLRDNRIPALYSASRRGWHVRMDRISDVIAQAESAGIRVRVKAISR